MVDGSNFLDHMIHNRHCQSFFASYDTELCKHEGDLMGFITDRLLDTHFHSVRLLPRHNMLPEEGRVPRDGGSPQPGQAAIRGI
jgi:hypothetical protein